MQVSDYVFYFAIDLKSTELKNAFLSEQHGIKENNGILC
jgi:hypothetical protein